MGFKQFYLQEDPDEMTIHLDSTHKGKRDWWRFDHTLTFGWYNGHFISTSPNKPVLIDGHQVDLKKSALMIDTIKGIEYQIGNFNFDHYFKNIMGASYANSTQMFNVHYQIRDLASEYLMLEELYNEIKSTNPKTPDDVSDIIDKLYRKIPLYNGESRQGFDHAGRLFPKIKGISFWEKAPSKDKILHILRFAGESPEEYIVEELNGTNQFPLDNRMFFYKLQSSEKDEQQLARELLDKRKRELKDKERMLPKKNAMDRFYQTVGD